MAIKRNTIDEKIELVKKVDKLRAERYSAREASTQVGISDCSYYTWKKAYCSKQSKEKDSTKQSEDKGGAQNCSKQSKKESSTELGECDVQIEVKPIPASKISPEGQKRVLEVKATFPHMGVKQLHQYLKRNHKLIYSERQIRQLLETEGVPKIKTVFPPQPVRRFERDLPNEMWQIDIMNFHVAGTSLYLMSFLDDFSRFIVSYRVEKEQTTGMIMGLLKRAISFRKPLSIITDRGIQFCSWNGVTAFQLELRSKGIDHLVAREQHPETMGKIEAFHKTIKRELLTTTEFSGTEEAREQIHDYIMYYNFARLASL